MSEATRYWPQGDWRDQREVHRLLEELKPDASVDPADWEYVGRVIKAYRQMRVAMDQPTCGHCQRPIEDVVIRCVDCLMPLHQRVCAPAHFWPNGRPPETLPKPIG